MRSLTLAAVLCMASSPANTVRIPMFGALLSCVADIPLGRKLRQASLELVSYTYDTFLFERRKLQNIVCCCVRDTIALFKRLLRFWATFLKDTILARSKSASLLL